jgi:CheY-like chemotaxis protein
MPDMVGSEDQLQQVFMNLISNAVEAMEGQSESTLTIETKHVSGEGRLTVAFTDNGVGIAPEHAEKVFEPFYSRKRMGRSGTGLGMAVIWGTVKDHKGFIDLQSTAGEGTTVSLYFPITPTGKVQEKSSIAVERYMGHNESILVVDDSTEQREILARILTRLGYDVVAVGSGEEAIDYVRHHPVQLLILDMIMDPGIDGLETYQRILEFQPNQKAIIASGFSETERVRTAQRLGAGPYIKKPYTLEKIGVAVMEELSK